MNDKRNSLFDTLKIIVKTENDAIMVNKYSDFLFCGLHCYPESEITVVGQKSIENFIAILL